MVRSQGEVVCVKAVVHIKTRAKRLCALCAREDFERGPEGPSTTDSSRSTHTINLVSTSTTREWSPDAVSTGTTATGGRRNTPTINLASTGATCSVHDVC